MLELGGIIEIIVGICVIEKALALKKVLLDAAADGEAGVVIGDVVMLIEELNEDAVAEDMTMVITVLNCEKPVGSTALKVSVIGDTMLDVVRGMVCAVVSVISGNSREDDVEDVALELKLSPEAGAWDTAVALALVLLENSRVPVLLKLGKLELELVEPELIALELELDELGLDELDKLELGALELITLELVELKLGLIELEMELDEPGLGKLELVELRLLELELLEQEWEEVVGLATESVD